MSAFNRRGQEKVYFAPSIASLAAPTVAELNTAGKNITPALREVGGFKFGGSTEDSADMDSLFPKTVAGMQTVDQSSIKCKEGDGDATDFLRVVEALLPLNATGFIVFTPQGVAATGKRARVWPISVIANSPDESADSGVATLTVSFSHPSAPTLNAVIA